MNNGQHSHPYGTALIWRRRYAYCECVALRVFFTLTDRASTIPSNVRGCQSGSSTWFAGQKNKYQRNTGINNLLTRA